MYTNTYIYMSVCFFKYMSSLHPINLISHDKSQFWKNISMTNRKKMSNMSHVYDKSGARVYGKSLCATPSAGHGNLA